MAGVYDTRMTKRKNFPAGIRVDHIKNPIFWTAVLQDQAAWLDEAADRDDDNLFLTMSGDYAFVDTFHPRWREPVGYVLS